MKVIRRYFKVKPDSELMSQVISKKREELKQKNNAYKLVKSVGATTVYCSMGKYQKFDFDNDPYSKTYKKMHGGWYPKKSTKEGKALIERINEIGKVINLDDLILEMVGLWSGPMVIGTGLRMHQATVIVGINPDYLSELPPQVIITMPWYEESKEAEKKLTEYRALKEKGERSDSSLNFYIMEHSICTNKDVEEIKKWETEKIIDEYNERSRQLEAKDKEG